MLLLLKYILLVLCCFVLLGCNKVHNPASKQGIASPFNLPKEAYLGLAKRQTGDEQYSLLIMAAGRAIDDGDLKEASTLLAALPQLPPVLSQQKFILQAKIKSTLHEPKEAIRLLAGVHDVQEMSLFYQVQYHEILAVAYDATKNFPEAIGEHIILDTLLQTEEEKIRNRRVLWLTLNHLPEAELNTMIAERGDLPELQGWLKLVRIAQTQGLKRQALLDKIYTWQEEYQHHPAHSMLSKNIISGKNDLYKQSEQVALLLPMTGVLAGPGNAVYDGFMAAIVNKNITVKTYDTATSSATSLYEKALADGADFIIGPLSKADAIAIAPLSHPVPTLLLNETEKRKDNNTYFLTLSPVHEAKLVAMKARKDGYKHALIVAPNTNWGDEVVLAFQHQWHAHGGQVANILRYDKNTELKSAIHDLLHDDGENFDMVFLLAYPSKAREIMPLLKYYDLGKAQVFATSSVYAGSIDASQDRDLDGIIFCDMSYVFTHNLPNKHWPEQLNSYSRLYALGLDSAILVENINKLLLFPAMGVNNQGELLYLTHDNQVVRLLTWGTFRHGKAEVLQ